MQLKAVDITIGNFLQAWFARLSSEKSEYVFCFLASQSLKTMKAFSDKVKNIKTLYIYELLSTKLHLQRQCKNV